MKNELSITFTGEEIALLCDILDFYWITHHRIKIMGKSTKQCVRLRTKINKLIPKSWGWTS